MMTALPLAALALVACGDGGDSEPEATPTIDPTVSIQTFGPAPNLGDNIVKVTPAHATQVTQLSTRTNDPTLPKGFCVDVTFEGLPGSGQWFRMAFDGQEITTEATWTNIKPSLDAAETGTVCYAPPEGFKVGKHQAAVSVMDPNTFETRKVVGWGFEVIP